MSYNHWRALSNNLSGWSPSFIVPICWPTVQQYWRILCIRSVATCCLACCIIQEVLLLVSNLLLANLWSSSPVQDQTGCVYLFRMCPVICANVSSASSDMGLQVLPRFPQEFLCRGFNQATMVFSATFISGGYTSSERIVEHISKHVLIYIYCYTQAGSMLPI